MSVIGQSDRFPSPPRIDSASFQCPYYRLELDYREAEGDRQKCVSLYSRIYAYANEYNNRQYIIRDFEPYFCIFKLCDTPLDVPQIFNGLLAHLQEHQPFLYHIDTSDGQHKEFNEKDFDKQVKIESRLPYDILHTIKAASLQRGALTFTSYAFCGGYLDIIEKLHPDLSAFEAQIRMQKYIKRHMQEISLWLPPYREDVSYKSSTESPVASRRYILSQSGLDISAEHDLFCDRKECDCHTLGDHKAELKLGSEGQEKKIESLEDEDFWPSLINNPDVYNRSAISIGEVKKDEALSIFKLYQAPESAQHTIDHTRLPPQPPYKYTIGQICSATVGQAAAE